MGNNVATGIKGKGWRVVADAANGDHYLYPFPPDVSGFSDVFRHAERQCIKEAYLEGNPDAVLAIMLCDADEGFQKTLAKMKATPVSEWE